MASFAIVFMGLASFLSVRTVGRIGPCTVLS